jgi:hypothetical protein
MIKNRKLSTGLVCAALAVALASCASIQPDSKGLDVISTMH